MFVNIPPFAFVIDTEKYAGNFERELCAYATGILGDCKVGSEEAAEFKNDNPGENQFEDIVLQTPDDHGCLRPVAKWPTPGWFDNEMHGHFREGDAGASQKAQDHFRKECLKYGQTKPYAADADNRRYEAEWRAKSEKLFTKNPAYLSVAIFFAERPEENHIELIKQRARIFCEREKIPLTGFRILELSLKVIEITCG